MAFVEALNFETLFIDYFAGTAELFYLIGLLVIFLAATKLRMNLLMGMYFVFAFSLILFTYAITKATVVPLLLVMTSVGAVVAVFTIWREVKTS